MKSYNDACKIIILLQIALFGDCNNTHSPDKLEFTLSMQQEIRNKIPAGNILVYYHPGDCSFCYGTLLSLSSEYSGLTLVSISSTKNRFLVDFYLEQIGFHGISFSDSTTFFLERNQKILIENNLFLIDSQYNILARSKDLTEKFREQIK